MVFRFGWLVIAKNRLAFQFRLIAFAFGRYTHPHGSIGFWLWGNGNSLSGNRFLLLRIEILVFPKQKYDVFDQISPKIASKTSCFFQILKKAKIRWKRVVSHANQLFPKRLHFLSPPTQNIFWILFNPVILSLSHLKPDFYKNHALRQWQIVINKFATFHSNLTELPVNKGIPRPKKISIFSKIPSTAISRKS